MAPIYKTRSLLAERSWIRHPFQDDSTLNNQLTTIAKREIDLSCHVAIVMLLGLTCFQSCPELKKFAAEVPPEALWTTLVSPWFWTWKLWDWSSVWSEVLRDCARTFDGCLVDSIPATIANCKDAKEKFTSITRPHIDGMFPRLRPQLP